MIPDHIDYMARQLVNSTVMSTRKWWRDKLGIITPIELEHIWNK